MCSNLRLVVLGALLSLSSSASGQRASAEASIRVAVIGQTDSTGLDLADRVRQRIAAATRNGHAVIIQARDIAMILEQLYRGPTDPIGIQDIREIGKLLRANIVLALVYDTVHVGNVEAIVFRMRAVYSQARIVGARTLGSWPSARVGQTSIAIVRAFQSDSLYHQLVSK